MLTVDKTQPHCWMHFFLSGPSTICSDRRIEALQAVRYHTEQAANNAADWLEKELRIQVQVYCIQILDV